MHVSRLRLLASTNQMQLIVFANFQPDMAIIAKRIGYDLCADDTLIKGDASLQVRNVQCDVIEMGIHGISKHEVAISTRRCLVAKRQGAAAGKPPLLVTSKAIRRAVLNPTPAPGR